MVAPFGSSRLGAAALAAALVGGCVGDAPPGTYPVQNDGTSIAVTPDALRDFVVGGGSRNWQREAMPHPSAGPHGLVQSAFNDLYAAARRADRYPMPVGAASAKELFEDDGRHKGWALSIKVADGEGSDTWLWWEADAPDYSPRGYGVGIFQCDRCHGGSSFDRSLTARLP